jgi:hypothetical protein
MSSPTQRIQEVRCEIYVRWKGNKVGYWNWIGMKLEKQWEKGLCVCWTEHNGNM